MMAWKFVGLIPSSSPPSSPSFRRNIVLFFTTSRRICAIISSSGGDRKRGSRPFLVLVEPSNAGISPHTRRDDSGSGFLTRAMKPAQAGSRV